MAKGAIALSVGYREDYLTEYYSIILCLMSVHQEATWPHPVALRYG